MIKTGIYKIENKINGKFYIGYSKNIIERWYSHKSLLRRNIHKNKYLQFAWNKYGEHNFNFCIVEECLKSELCEKEFFYIKSTQSTNRNIGYNIEHGDPNQPMRTPSSLEIKNFMSMRNELVECFICGKKMNKPNYHKYHGKNCGKKRVVSNETKLKISIKNKGRVVSLESRKKASDSMKGRKYSEEHISNMIKNKKKIKHTSETIDKMRRNSTSNIKVYQYDLDGVFMSEYNSIREASLSTGIGQSTIRSHINKEIKINSGLKHRWSNIRYYNKELHIPFTICMMDMNTKEEIKRFRTIKEAGDYLCKNPASIYKNLTNKSQAVALGYTWKVL